MRDNKNPIPAHAPRGILPRMTATTRDPATPDFLDAARDLLGYIFFSFGQPADFASHPGVWQWWKFDLLDWLRPLEKLLRRILLIEAVHLALSQSRPLSRAPQRKTFARPRKRAPWDACDPAT